MVAVLLHCLQHSSEEWFVLEPETSTQKMQNGHIGRLEVADISVKFLIHVFEYTAILEGKTAYLLNVLTMLLLKDDI